MPKQHKLHYFDPNDDKIKISSEMFELFNDQAIFHHCLQLVDFRVLFFEAKRKAEYSQYCSCIVRSAVGRICQYIANYVSSGRVQSSMQSCGRQDVFREYSSNLKYRLYIKPCNTYWGAVYQLKNIAYRMLASQISVKYKWPFRSD